ncbi:hypothetical protein AVEN_208399-1 [Araneus ventricosus]|uniref:Gustatory receptor n=1 Tax=Araneus ventricosus TaxID=182803 RepID=A0A4Y2NH17_ARAVE|nr:hypothetical protein AVEN_208399-1 [Araneus ventricosus]
MAAISRSGNSRKTLMDGSADIKWLLRCFIIIGIPFYEYGPKRDRSVLSIMKFAVKLVFELFFTSFGVYIVFNCAIGFPANKCFLRLTTTALSIILLSFRLSVAFKRSQILYLMNVLKKFRDAHQKQPRVYTRKDVAVTCLFIIGLPLMVSFAFLYALIRNYDEIKYNLKPNFLHFCGDNRMCILSTVPVYGSAYTLYFVIAPTLCMTLFFYTFITYEKSLRQMVLQTHHSLMTELSCENIERSMSCIIQATKVHQLIEDALSPSIFLTYVLVFVNFLNLVTINVANFATTMVNIRTLACIIMFIWTCGCFFHLTLKGSLLVDACNLWKDLQQDIVQNYIQKEICDSEAVLHLLLFNGTAKLDLAFTGWGMFQLDRSLLLTMVGVIVSYGVLIATI